MTTQTGDPRWLRPKVPQLNPDEDPIVFQLVEIDHHERTERTIGTELTKAPVVRMFGVTKEGNSIMCHVSGFYPYFYVCTAKKPDLNKLDAFREILDARCKKSHLLSPALSQQVVRVDYLAAQSIYGYSGSGCGPQQQHFLKITVSLPRIMKHVQDVLKEATKDLLSMGVYLPGAADERGHQFFETNIEYELRFMVDSGINGLSWIELAPSNYWLLEVHNERLSCCQIECDITHSDLIVHDNLSRGPWMGYAPIRTLSFDIECMVRGDIFPQAHCDAVLQIANVVVQQGAKEPLVNCIFTLRSCAPIEGATVRSFGSEREMLLAWSEFVAQVDPDIITGYNIHIFDIKYLLERAQVLNITQFPYLGRLANVKTEKHPIGAQKSYFFNIEGRIQVDLIKVLRNDYKLSSYSLQNVSRLFLGDSKEDVHYSQIVRLFNGDEHTRKRLATYCLKDATLPLRLIDKLMSVINYMEMARVTGVPFRYMLTPDGQRSMVVSLMLREAKKHNYLLPTVQLARSAQKTPDFASLYPSVVIALNLCYTTLLSENSIERLQLEESDYIKTPGGFYFKRPDESHQTIVPQILESLVEAKRRAKVAWRRETDPHKKMILERRQWALKISSNSIHGFIGAQSTKVPPLGLPDSLSHFGRDMTNVPRKRVHEE